MIATKDKFVIYGCGGMSSFGRDEFETSNEWREDLKQMFEYASNNECEFINPNDHFNFADNTGYRSEREVMEFDLYKVRHSDLIVVNFNDPKSIGSACEIAIAYDRGIPIIGLCENNEELHPWFQQDCMCNRIFDNREELVLYVTQHYILQE